MLHQHAQPIDSATAAGLGRLQKPRDRVRMQKVLNHLHDHYDQLLRLQPLCDLAHLTESQLQRIFKRSTRMSISAYVGQLRLGRACQMLVQI